MSPNYPRSSEWPKNLWIAPDRANRTLILPAWSNKQPEEPTDWRNRKKEECLVGRREAGRDSCVTREPGAGRWWWWWRWWPSQYAVSILVIPLLSRYRHPPPHFSPDIEFFLSQPTWKPVSQSFGAAEDVWDVNKQDVDWRHFMMLPSSLSGTGPLPLSPVVRWTLFCGHQSKPRLVTLSSPAWHIVCLENTDRQTQGHKYLREQVRKLFAQEVTLRLAFSSRLCVFVIYDFELDSVLWLWHEPIKSGKKSFPDPVLTSRYWRLALYPC